MSDFSWGDPHPLPIDRQKHNHESNKRAARHYANQLGEADDAYLRGSAGVTAGLEQYDREAGNVHKWQIWVAEECARGGEDAAIAALSRDLALSGAWVSDLRRAPQELAGLFRKAVRACRRLGDRKGEAVALGNLGNVCADLGVYQEAIDCHTRSLELSRELGDRRAEGNAHGNLGNVHVALGAFETAIECYQRNFRIAEGIEDRQGMTAALGNLGSVHADLGNYPEALAYHDRCLVLARDFGDRRAEGGSLCGLGNVHFARGELAQAITFWSQSLAVSRELWDRKGEGQDLSNLGSAHARGGGPALRRRVHRGGGGPRQAHRRPGGRRGRAWQPRVHPPIAR